MTQSFEPAMEQVHPAINVGQAKVPPTRMSASRRKALAIGVQLGFVVIGLIVGGILIVTSGANPFVAYRAVVTGAFGSNINILETLTKATPLILVGLGVTIAFRASVYNVGSEGQLQMGAMTATALGILLFDSTLPGIVLIPLLIVAGFAGGAAWGGLAAAMKVKFNVSEVVATIMMNFIAQFFVIYMIVGPLQDKGAGGTPITTKIVKAGEFPRFFQSVLGSRVHLGLFLGLVAAVLVYTYLWRTVAGYQLRAVGANKEASRLAGISIGRNTILALVIAGGLAGLAGVSEIGGLHHRLIEGFSPRFGSTGLLVALMGKLHPVGVVAAAILFGGLLIGTDAMTRVVDVPGAIVFVMQGAIVLSVLAGESLARVWGLTE